MTFFTASRMKREAVNILAAGAEKTEEVKGEKGGPALTKTEFGLSTLRLYRMLLLTASEESESCSLFVKACKLLGWSS